MVKQLVIHQRLKARVLIAKTYYLKLKLLAVVVRIIFLFVLPRSQNSDTVTERMRDYPHPMGLSVTLFVSVIQKLNALAKSPSGRHVVKSDLTACPECDFPALRNEFIEILESEDQCPMCSEKVDSRRLVKIQNTKPYLNIE
ncbi:hypothetical protein NQ317_012459 [Molorchus minor]|uniref:Uncharacterized protein n=1 Tax=Molorchus minor TaxID=1323400 RepID=A0ABQ9JA33_9CUCU|nr:hypothetical protein NQ317_012459 [Molorchus minor]